MYVPRHFSLPEDYARALLANPGVGNLVTVIASGPEATMVPFYLDEEKNALVTHLVKNNPQAADRPICTATIGPGGQGSSSWTTSTPRSPRTGTPPTR